MDKMEWAIWALDYLTKARTATHDDFNAAMNELKGYNHITRGESWYSSCKSIIPTLYHFSMEFLSDREIPSAAFSSPDVFDTELSNYRAFVQAMRDELDDEAEKYKQAHEVDGPPSLVFVAMRQVENVIGALDYVRSKEPEATVSSVPEDPLVTDVDLVVGIARRFHESVLSLAKHPHGGATFTVANEWDCQYLFRAILAAYFVDIRDEEWNPSVAGSAARCEFFLKPLRTMIELKFIRKASDAKKVKAELALDFLDYGANPLVDHVVCLVYDPTHALKNPVALISDLSGSKQGIGRVDVVVSPPRS